MKGKILITGSSGLVGSRFVELFAQKELLLTPDEVEFNLLQPETLQRYLDTHHPEVVINFAAYTDVTAAEKERHDQGGLCWKINVSGVSNLVSALDSSTRLIQISTDMVFSGSSTDPGPYSEKHPPETDSTKVTWYGYTKSQAELEVGPNGTIVRIIYPVRSAFPAKLDYLRKPLKLFDQGQLYPLFNDQHISLAFIDEIALGLQKIISLKPTGVFHISSTDTTTPYEIISYLLEKARGVTGVVKPASVRDLGNPVRYPQFGGLNSKISGQKLDLKFKSVREIVDELIVQGLSV